MELSFTLGGGLGDYILNYLGSPGNRLPYLLKTIPNIQCRVSAECPAGIELLKNTSLFQQIHVYNEKLFVQNRLDNDIQFISNLKIYPKLMPSLWLDDDEEEILAGIERPYGVFHPFASKGARQLNFGFDTHIMAQWAADVSGINMVVLGNEDFGYESHNVKQIKGSPRLATKIVERATFFLGSHSSMQCAAWVFEIPSFCLGPSQLLFHNMYSPSNNDLYLKPLYKRNNIFMFYDQGDRFSSFFDHFLRKATCLLPQKKPQECRRKISLSRMASELQPFSDKESY